MTPILTVEREAKSTITRGNPQLIRSSRNSSGSSPSRSARPSFFEPNPDIAASSLLVSPKRQPKPGNRM